MPCRIIHMCSNADSFSNAVITMQHTFSTLAELSLHTERFVVHSPIRLRTACNMFLWFSRRHDLRAWFILTELLGHCIDWNIVVAMNWEVFFFCQRSRNASWMQKLILSPPPPPLKNSLRRAENNFEPIFTISLFCHLRLCCVCACMCVRLLQTNILRWK